MLYVKHGENRLHDFREDVVWKFENVDDAWATDACLYYKLTYEPSAQVS